MSVEWRLFPCYAEVKKSGFQSSSAADDAQQHNDETTGFHARMSTQTQGHSIYRASIVSRDKITARTITVVVPYG